MLAVMGCWTAVAAYAYPPTPRRRWPLLLADLVVTGACLLSTVWVETRARLVQGVPPLTATWLVGPVNQAASDSAAEHGVLLPEPLTTARMHAAVVAQTAREGAAAMRHQPYSGIPFKVYAAQAGRDRTGLAAFLWRSALARGTRILGFGPGLTAFGAIARRRRRFYAWRLALFGVCFTGFLAAIVASWS